MSRIPLILIPFAMNICFADVLFTDNFNDGDDNGWTHVGAASFKVINSEYFVYSQGSRGLGITLNGNDSGVMSTADYSILCSILVECGTEAGVLARYTGEDQWCYRIVLKPSISKIYLERKKHSGPSITLDQYDFDSSFGSRYWVRLQVHGDSVMGRIWEGSPDDEPDIWHLEAVDAVQQEEGSFGLFAGGFGKSKVSWSTVFDDVVVSTAVSQDLSQVSWGFIKYMDPLK